MKRQIVALAAEETRVVMWDMDAVLEDYREAEWIPVETRRLVPREWLTIDREYAMGTDPERPVVVFEIMDGLAFLADGNHRVYRAAAEGIPEMWAIVLTEREHLKYLYRSTEADYRSVLPELEAEGIFIPRFR